MASTNTNIGVTLQDKASVALKALSNNLKGVDSSVNKLKSSMGGFSAALAPLASVASIAGLTMLGKSAIESAAQIGRLSEQVGISTETLSAYKYIAEQANVPFEVFSKTLFGITKRVSEASNGMGEAKDVLIKLGLDAKKLAQLAPDKQFLLIADAMQKVKNPTDAIGMAMKLAGEEGARPFLTIIKDGSAGIIQAEKDAKALGLAYGKDVTDGAIKAQQDIAKLKSEFTGIATALAIDVLPLLQKFTEQLKNVLTWYRNLSPDQKEFYNTMVLLGIAIPIVVSTLTNLVTVVKAAIPVFTAFKAFITGGGLVAAASNPIVLTLGAIALAVTGAVVAYKELKKIQSEVKPPEWVTNPNGYDLSLGRLDQTNPAYIYTPKVNPVNELTKRDVVEKQKQVNNDLLKQFTFLKDLDGTKIEFIPAQTVSDAEKAKFAMADFVRIIKVYQDALNRGINISELGFDDAGNMVEQIRLYDSVANDVLNNEKNRVAESTKLASDRVKYMEALALSMQQFGSVGVQQAGLAGKSPVEEYVSLGSVAIENLKAGFTDLGNGITEVMGGALTGVYEQLFGLSEGAIMVGRAFGRMVSSVLGSLTAMIAKLLIAAGLTAIISSVFGGGAGATKIIGALNSWAGIGKRASGGPVGMGKPYLVGEMGPELFIPNNTGRIVSNNQLGSGRTVNVTNNITIDSKGDIFSNKLMMNRLASVINDEIERSVKKQYYATA